MTLIKSILKNRNTPKYNKTVSFGENVVHSIPNRLELLRKGELKTLRLSRFRLTTTENKENNNTSNYNKVGRFSIKRIKA